MVVRNKVTVAKDGFDSHRGLLKKIIGHGFTLIHTDKKEARMTI